MEEAARAVAYIHHAGVIHRDLKPVNFLVDGEGQCWLIDFGLAVCARDSRLAPHSAGGHPPPAPVAVTDAGVTGTPQYMAPEQFDFQADERSDVWGLGATLYELLALRPAFAEDMDAGKVRDRIRSEAPPAPCQVNAAVPAELSAMAHKALERDPGRRYARAQDLADDLARWLRHEPTVALPPGLRRRVRLWAQRNRGWAAALGLVLLTLLSITALAVGWALYQGKKEAAARALADAEGARAATVQAKADAAQQRERDRQRADLLEQVRALSRPVPRAGWWAQADELLRRAAGIRRDGALRKEAAAVLSGIDAPGERLFPKIAASAVGFDRAGRRLLLGGTADVGARVWDVSGKPLCSSRQLGPGPVAFSPEGTPLQLAADPADRGTLLLRYVAADQVIRRFAPLSADGKTRVPVRSFGALAVTPDGGWWPGWGCCRMTGG
jgi:hypothetical protein